MHWCLRFFSRLTFSWMTPLFARKGADLADAVDAAAVLDGWPCPAGDHPRPHAERIQAGWDAAVEQHGDQAELLGVLWAGYRGRWLRLALLKVAVSIHVSIIFHISEPSIASNLRCAKRRGSQASLGRHC